MYLTLGSLESPVYQLDVWPLKWNPRNICITIWFRTIYCIGRWFNYKFKIYNTFVRFWFPKLWLVPVIKDSESLLMFQNPMNELSDIRIGMCSRTVGKHILIGIGLVIKITKNLAILAGWFCNMFTDSNAICGKEMSANKKIRMSFD